MYHGSNSSLSQSKAEEVCVQLSGDYEEQLEAVSPSESLSYIVWLSCTVVHLEDAYNITTVITSILILSKPLLSIAL